MNNTIIALLITVASAAAVTTQAQTVYTDGTAFTNAATTAIVPLSYRAPANNARFEPEGSSFTSGTITYNSPGNVILFNDGYYGAGNFYLSTGNGGTIDISGGANAVQFNLGRFLGAGTIDLSVNGGIPAAYSIPGAPDSQFFGIIDSDLITEITIVGTGEIDFVEPFSAATPTPEPGTMALAGLGIAGMVAARRRQK